MHIRLAFRKAAVGWQFVERRTGRARSIFTPVGKHRSGISYRANAFVEGHVSGSKRNPFDDFRVTDAVHAEVSEILTRRIPSHKIPERRQNQQSLRFNMPLGPGALSIGVPKPETQTTKKRPFERGQEVRHHCLHIGGIDLRRERPHIKASQKSPQVTKLVGWQRLFDLGEPGIREVRKRQRRGGTHACYADNEPKNHGPVLRG